MNAFRSRIPIIIYVSRSPSPVLIPITPEMIAAMMSSMIMKLLNCSKNMTMNGLFFFCTSVFFPYFSRRAAISSFFRPRVLSVPISLATFSAVRL